MMMPLGSIALRVSLHFGLNSASGVVPAVSSSRIASCERESRLGSAVSSVGCQVIGRVPLQFLDRHWRW